jgi:hypothetical protein
MRGNDTGMDGPEEKQIIVVVAWRAAVSQAKAVAAFTTIDGDKSEGEGQGVLCPF